MFTRMKAEGKIHALLGELLTAKHLAAATKAVEQLEARYGLTWRPVGGRETNFGQIEIGADGGYALIERVTNAIDAVLEFRALQQKKSPMPTSPRDASAQWLGVPDGRLANLRAANAQPDLKKRQDLANNVCVRLHDGASKRTPTVEIVDAGTGLTPSQMPTTILSLGESNKIDKRYLAGAYGQGGSTAFAFSKAGTLIVSRRQPLLQKKGDDDVVAITFVRYNQLDPDQNKNGRYEYLVLKDGVVPSVPASLAEDVSPGTRVVHYDMDIQKYGQRMTQPVGSLWWLLQNSLFDPVLPVWAEERRTNELEQGKAVDRRVIVGNYTRLSDDKKDKVEFSDNLTVTIGDGQAKGTVKVNYWVIRDDADGGTPIAGYVDPYRPIVYTLHGQTHGSDERRFITERLHLPNLARSLIVHAELDNLPAVLRREILSSTRDRLKQTPTFDTLREKILQGLAYDEELTRLEDERRERLLSKHSDRDKEKLKQRFAKLMERFLPGRDAPAGGKGGKEGPTRESKQSSSREAPVNIKTRSEPTYLKIANTQKPMRLELGRAAVLRLESDAPDGYLNENSRAQLALSTEPPNTLDKENHSDFRGGRARVMLKVGEKIKPGQKGTLSIFLFTAKGVSLQDKISFVVDPPRDASTPSESKGKSNVQVPDPIPVTHEQWQVHGWNEHSVAKVQESRTTTEIYVNIDNIHLRKLLSGAGYQQVGLKRMQNSFVLYVGFYAYARHLSVKGMKAGMPADVQDEYEQRELDRLAQTVIHAISSAGRLDADED